MGVNFCPSPCKMQHASVIQRLLDTIIWIHCSLVALLGNFTTRVLVGGAMETTHTLSWSPRSLEENIISKGHIRVSVRAACDP